jgi:hypothetical protein
MPEERKPDEDQAKEPSPPAASTESDKDDVADFITRNVLEKDSVFFEG